MNRTEEILEQVKTGELSVPEAEKELEKTSFVDLGYSKVDTARKERQGAAEVIYGEGKTPEQISGIVKTLLGNGEERVLITRLDTGKAETLKKEFPLDYRKDARLGIIGKMPSASKKGLILVATGGTSDIPVAEEAAVTAEFYGNRVERLYDVGVAGIHRLLAHKEQLDSADCIIAVAGMEGALCSVIAGLVSCPVIGVPTSVGYGASFHGLSSLLSMLNSCAGGVSVVNIDNGFGAGFLANRINKQEVDS